MGQKVHPYGFRLGVIRDWQSRWYADKEYKDLAIEDNLIRKYLRSRLPTLFSAGASAAATRRGGGGGRGGGGRGGRGGRGLDAGVSQIEIERMANVIKVTMHTARPGLIIGRGGRGIDDLRAELERVTPRKVQLNVMEIKQPELDAQLVAESVGSQIERRVSFKRAIRLAIARTMQRGGKGIKIIVGGRLGGAEIARSYSDKDGKIPLHTLRADIDYGFSEARTQYGNIGVKVWIYRGEILPGEAIAPPAARQAAVRVAQPTAAAAPTGAEPAAAPEKKKGWRRVPKEEAAAIAAAAESVESPEEVAGKAAEGTGLLTQPVETIEETPVAATEAETPSAPEAEAPAVVEAAAPETEAPSTEAGSEAPDLDKIVLVEEEGDINPEDQGR
jgi:small subunit ribosomal protein S3